MCVAVGIHQYTDFLLVLSKLCRKCLCYIVGGQNGCLCPAFSCFLFFLLCPFQCIVRLCSSPQGLSWEIHPNHGPYGFRAAEPFNPGVQLAVAVMGRPEASSKSLQIVPSIQILRLGKYTHGQSCLLIPCPVLPGICTKSRGKMGRPWLGTREALGR